MMAIFKRKSATPSANLDLSRFNLRQVLIFSTWFPCAVFLHYEKHGKNFLNARLNAGDWNVLEVKSRSDGDAKMMEIRDNWKSSISLGLLPSNSDFYAHDLKTFGFGEIDFSKISSEFNADFVFTLGREIDEKLRDGWFPSSESEISLTFNYLGLAPLRVGFFGSYKFILKKLTDIFPSQLDSLSVKDASLISAAIGLGYGRIEAFLSRGMLAPKSEYDWRLDEIQSLPELNGFIYPRLKTMQYMMRKGCRFLNHLEANADPFITTRFKIHVLRGADSNHQISTIKEEYYLKYQQLVTRIIFNNSELAVRDRESRKMILGPKIMRHNISLPDNFVNSLSQSEINSYKTWITDLSAKNTAITIYALALSRAIPGIEFKWTEQAIATLFNSESTFAKKAIWEAIEKEPSLLRSVPASALVQFINSASPAQFELITNEMRSYIWPFTVAIDLWVTEHMGRKLNEYELLVATQFLQIAWGNISNVTWFEGSQPNRDILFLQVASQTKLEPIEDWQKVFTYYQYDDQIFLAFYGLATSAKYSKGLLDVLDIRNNKMLTLFAYPIVNHVNWITPEKLIEFLMVFHNSTKLGANELLWTIIGKQMLPADKQEIIMAHLNSLDSSGAIYLKAISTALALDDEQALLGHLVTLSDASKESFWRRNKSEAEAILMGWKGFANFYWNNIESIPLPGIEKLRKFEGLNSKLLKFITPSSVARMNFRQIEEFIGMIKSNPDVCSNINLLRAMITAPSAGINSIAAKYVKDENKYNLHWLLMLESNLPISQESALKYLESQVEAKDFSAKLLMALDSNNAGARKLALSVLAKIKTPSVLKKVVEGLVENRNTDTWKVVARNIGLISSVDKYKEFTNQVFLSRRKGRNVKEDIKFNIDQLIENILEAVEQDTLIRMAHSTVSSDRDWALRKIALSGSNLDGVSIETTWKGSLNV
jgi:hypothetical protein